MLSALVGAGVSKAPVLQRAWDLARKRHIRLNLEVVVAVKKCQGLILGKIDDKRRRQQVMRQLDSITDSMDMNEQIPGDIGGQRSLACCMQSTGL